MRSHLRCCDYHAEPGRVEGRTKNSRHRDCEFALIGPLADKCTASGKPETQSTTRADHCRCQVNSTRTGISFLTGIVKREGGSILKSESVAGIVPEIVESLPRCATWNGTCLYRTVCPANWISMSARIAADVDSDSGNRVRTMTIGNCAPRVTWSI